MWVEGPTDIYFYQPLLSGLECRLEAFHGATNADALVEGLKKNDYPYVLILDGDYHILLRHRSKHKRIIRLSRYSFENFLWEQDHINTCCHRHARSGERTNLIGPQLVKLAAQIDAHLTELVVLDVAARQCNPAPQVLPDRIEPLAQKQGQPDICPVKAAAIASKVAPQLPVQKIAAARALVQCFLKSRPLIHLLKGHLVLGVIRYVFTCTTKIINAAASALSEDALTQLLSQAVWHRPPSEEHKRLRRKLRTQVRSLHRFLKPST